MLSHKRLRDVLDYDEETGQFTWVKKTCRKVKPGALAGHTKKSGYIIISIDGRAFYAHRLAVFWMTGQMPPHMVDHIDRNPSNNAWKNLRLADGSLNGHNRAAGCRNTSGRLGVSWVSAIGKWRAQIMISGEHRHLGVFEDPDQAETAYISAKQEAFEYSKGV